MYFGTTYAPERVERNTMSETVLRASSETMSTALLPIPTTSTRLPYRSSGVLGSMYSCEWICGPVEAPREVRVARVPVVAVADQQRIEGLLLGRRRA